MHDMTPQRFAKAKQQSTEAAMEVTARLYASLLKMEPFKLLDGTPVSVRAYVPPHLNKVGEPECGVDVVTPDGHLEFMIRNTGWGRSFVKDVGTKGAKRQRGR